MAMHSYMPFVSREHYVDVSYFSTDENVLKQDDDDKENLLSRLCLLPRVSLQLFWSGLSVGVVKPHPSFPAIRE